MHAVFVGGHSGVRAGSWALGISVCFLCLAPWGGGERASVHKPHPAAGRNVEGAGAVRAALWVQAAAVLQRDGAHAAAPAAREDAGLTVAVGGAVHAVAVARHLRAGRHCIKVKPPGEDAVRCEGACYLKAGCVLQT